MDYDYGCTDYYELTYITNDYPPKHEAPSTPFHQQLINRAVDNRPITNRSKDFKKKCKWVNQRNRKGNQ